MRTTELFAWVRDIVLFIAGVIVSRWPARWSREVGGRLARCTTAIRPWLSLFTGSASCVLCWIFPPAAIGIAAVGVGYSIRHRASAETKLPALVMWMNVLGLMVAAVNMPVSEGLWKVIADFSGGGVKPGPLPDADPLQ